MRTTPAYLRTGTLLAVVCALLSLSGVTPALAVPATPQIAAKEAEAAAAQIELDRMNGELEVRIEEYNAISEALDQTRAEIGRTRADLEQAQRDLGKARATLSKRATTIYKDGGSGLLEVFLGARSFEDFVMRVELAVRINRADADMVADVEDAKSRVEASERALEQRQAEQITLQQEAAARAAQIESDVAAQQRFVGTLQGEVQTLIAQEQERQRLLAEERARQAAAAAARAAAGRTGGSATRAVTDPSSLGAGHPEAVDIALQYVGVPYLWAGSSPAGFDCSGLTQYCYRQLGISIPRTSQSQFNAGQPIARDRTDLLVPGDLVFFGTDGDDTRVHHVGMYVGDGNYIHAPNTGAFVRVDSLTARIASRGDYVGASRF